MNDKGFRIQREPVVHPEITITLATQIGQEAIAVTRWRFPSGGVTQLIRKPERLETLPKNIAAALHDAFELFNDLR